MECSHLFLFILRPRRDWNNRIIRVSKGKDSMLTPDSFHYSSFGVSMLVNGMILLTFPIVVPRPQRCILWKQELCPFSTEISTTGYEPPTGNFLIKPFKPRLPFHMGQSGQTELWEENADSHFYWNLHVFSAHRILINAVTPRSTPEYCEIFLSRCPKYFPFSSF